MKVLHEILYTEIFGNISAINISNNIVECINILLLLLYIVQIFNIRNDKKNISKYISLSIMLYFVEKMFIPMPYYRFIFIITITIVFIRIFKAKPIESIAINTMQICGLMLIEIPISKVYYHIYKVNGYDITVNQEHRIMVNATIMVILVSIYIITKKLNISTSLLEKSNKVENIKSMIFFIAGIAIMYIQLLEIEELERIALIKISVLNVISVILLYYISVNNIVKVCKIKKANTHINNLEEYNKNLTTINDSLRGFRHDFSNIVQAMNGYIMLKDIESLKRYFDELLEECDNVKAIEQLNLEIINNPAIYSILINKYQIAEKHNIKMKIDTLLDFKFVQERVYDISRMFGILLDNAIEATKDCEERIVNIQFCRENANKYLIIIENTYKNDIDTEKIYQKDFSTKKEKGNSGFGLWEVKKILSKNTSLNLQTTINNNIFRQQLEIYQ